MAIENFDFKEVLKKTIKEGTSNPWATSSTTHYKLVLWLKPSQHALDDDSLLHLFFDDEMDAIKEYVRENYLKSHPQAPICRGILRDGRAIDRTWDDEFQGKDGYASEWTIEYYETIYYN